MSSCYGDSSERLSVAMSSFGDTLRKNQPCVFEKYFYSLKGEFKTTLSRFFIDDKNVCVSEHLYRVPSFTVDEWRTSGQVDVSDAYLRFVDINNQNYCAALKQRAGESFRLLELSASHRDSYDLLDVIGNFAIAAPPVGWRQLTENASDAVQIFDDGVTTTYKMDYSSNANSAEILVVNITISAADRLLQAESFKPSTPLLTRSLKFQYDEDNATAFPNRAIWQQNYDGGTYGPNTIHFSRLQRVAEIDPEIFRLPFYGIDEPVQSSRVKVWLSLLLIFSGLSAFFILRRRNQSTHHG